MCSDKSEKFHSAIYQSDVGHRDGRDYGGVSIENVLYQILSRSCGKRVSQKAVAKILNVSPRTLSRKLKANGFTYRKILQDVKKNKALMLLQQTDLSVQDISSDLGYEDPSNFSAAFKMWTQLSPRDARKIGKI